MSTLLKHYGTRDKTDVKIIIELFDEFNVKHGTYDEIIKWANNYKQLVVDGRAVNFPAEVINNGQLHIIAHSDLNANKYQEYREFIDKQVNTEEFFTEHFKAIALSLNHIPSGNL